MARPDQFRKDMERAGDRLFPEIRKGLNEHGRRFVFKTMRHRLRGRPGLSSRTGALARSFGWEERGKSSDSWRGVAYTTSKYAPLQEHGGDVVPVRAKKLAIPLDAAKTPAGVARGTPRSFPNTFIQKSKAGNLIIFQKKGKDGVTPLFVLKDRVRIPPRLGFFDTWEDGAEDRTAVITRATARALRSGGGNA